MLLLYSGGPDSYIAWHYLKKPKTIYFNLGHRYATDEIIAIKRTIPNTIINTELTLGSYEQVDANIPMRNAFMLMIASQHDKELALIVQKGEMDIPDRSRSFLDKFQSWLGWMNNTTIEVFSPFTQMTKTQVVKWYIQKMLDPDDLRLTRSCFKAGLNPCGSCAACFRRWVAFSLNGIDEGYTEKILLWEGTKEYVRKMNEGKYDMERTDETFAALEKAGYNFDQ